MKNKIIITKPIYDQVITILNKAVVKNIKVYDMQSLTPFYDYTIIASVNSARQGVAAVNYLKKEASEQNLKVRSFSSSNETTWFLVDLDDIVVHLFVEGERERYNLDGMYGNNLLKVIE